MEIRDIIWCHCLLQVQSTDNFAHKPIETDFKMCLNFNLLTSIVCVFGTAFVELCILTENRNHLQKRKKEKN